MASEVLPEVKLTEEILSWNGEEIPFKFMSSYKEIRNVVLAEDTIVPGCSEIIIDAYIDKSDLDSWCTPQEFLIEPSPNFMDKYPLLMTASLVDVTKSITSKVRMMNPYNKDVMIHQNTVIGTAQINDGKVVLLIKGDEMKEDWEQVRRLHLDSKDKDVKITSLDQNEMVHTKIPNERPEPKPNISDPKSMVPDKEMSVPQHLKEIFDKTKRGQKL